MTASRFIVSFIIDLVLKSFYSARDACVYSITIVVIYPQEQAIANHYLLYKVFINVKWFIVTFLTASGVG